MEPARNADARNPRVLLILLVVVVVLVLVLVLVLVVVVVVVLVVGVVGVVGVGGVVVVVVVVEAVVVGGPAGRTAQKCTALLDHETKTTTFILNYCLGSTTAAFLLLGIFFGLIFFLMFSFFLKLGK